MRGMYLNKQYREAIIPMAPPIYPTFPIPRWEQTKPPTRAPEPIPRLYIPEYIDIAIDVP